MAIHKFDFRKVKPASAGQRRDYIKPGTYMFKVSSYSDKPSAGGKEMHSFTSEVVTKGEMAGKKITDNFAMPKTAKESQFPVERLLSFFIACGSKKAQGNVMEFDPKRLVGKTFPAEVYDKQEEASVRDGKTYPARTVSALQYGVEDVDDEDDEDADEEEDDEEEEEDEEEDEEEEDDEDSSDDDDDEEDEEDEDDEEEEEPEPEPVKAKKSSKPAAATKSKPKAAPAAKAKAKAAPAKASKKSKKDEEDFPFDD